jgi:hypothetical protein
MGPYGGRLLRRGSNRGLDKWIMRRRPMICNLYSSSNIMRVNEPWITWAERKRPLGRSSSKWEVLK